jgi:ribosomal protein L31
MKKNIHPKLNRITVTDGSGKSWELLSVLKNNIVLNSSKENHPAWTQTLNHETNKIDKIKKFDEFYSSVDISKDKG